VKEQETKSLPGYQGWRPIVSESKLTLTGRPVSAYSASIFAINFKYELTQT
jgi:hypothetical protein